LKEKSRIIRGLEGQLEVYANMQSELNKSIELENTVEEMQKNDRTLRN